MGVHMWMGVGLLVCVGVHVSGTQTSKTSTSDYNKGREESAW